MLRIAFATKDCKTVNMHFGGAESLALYDVVPGKAEMVAFSTFVKADTAGTSLRTGLTDTVQDKVLAKLDFVKHAHAVYAASIGASSIKRLMVLNIQPIIVDNGHDIVDLLNEVSLGMVYGGLSWIERAVVRSEKTPPPPIVGTTLSMTTDAAANGHKLLSSMDEL